MNTIAESSHVEAFHHFIPNLATIITVVSFTFGAQSRLTGRITPDTHLHQKSKAPEDISTPVWLKVTGLLNLLVVGLLLWQRQLGAKLALAYLGVGVCWGWSRGFPVTPALRTMGIVACTLLG